MNYSMASVFLPMLRFDPKQGTLLALSGYKRLISEDIDLQADRDVLRLASIPLVEYDVQLESIFADRVLSMRPQPEVIPDLQVRRLYHTLNAGKSLIQSVLARHAATQSDSDGAIQMLVDCLSHLQYAASCRDEPSASSGDNSTYGCRGECLEMHAQVCDSHHFCFHYYCNLDWDVARPVVSHLSRLATEYGSTKSVGALVGLYAELVKLNLSVFRVLADHLITDMDHPDGCFVIEFLRGGDLA